MTTAISTGVGGAGGALGGAVTSVGIPKERIPVDESGLRAVRFMVIAHGTPKKSRPPERCSTKPTITSSTTTSPTPQCSELPAAEQQRRTQ